MLFISLLSFTQKSSAPKKDNLLFMLRQPEHINQAIKTIDELMTQKSSKLNVGEIVIIVCGEAVVNLTMADAETWVDNTSKYKNVSLVACGLSLDKFKKREADLVKGVQYTRNGFIRAFELQKAGYLSVEL
jgi:intracellular sulfur oxidation DsrE/DsrF family protein